MNRRVDVPFGGSTRPLVEPGQASGSEEGVEEKRPGHQRLRAPASPRGPDDRPNPPSLTTRGRGLRRVASFISRQSGLDAEELQRRAERKIRAQLITPWMAYALVAREQGLVMDDIVKALDVN